MWSIEPAIVLIVLVGAVSASNSSTRCPKVTFGSLNQCHVGDAADVATVPPLISTRQENGHGSLAAPQSRVSKAMPHCSVPASFSHFHALSQTCRSGKHWESPEEDSFDEVLPSSSSRSNDDPAQHVDAMARSSCLEPDAKGFSAWPRICGPLSFDSGCHVCVYVDGEEGTQVAEHNHASHRSGRNGAAVSVDRQSQGEEGSSSSVSLATMHTSPKIEDDDHDKNPRLPVAAGDGSSVNNNNNTTLADRAQCPSSLPSLVFKKKASTTDADARSTRTKSPRIHQKTLDRRGATMGSKTRPKAASWDAAVLEIYMDRGLDGWLMLALLTGCSLIVWTQ